MSRYRIIQKESVEQKLKVNVADVVYNIIGHGSKNNTIPDTFIRKSIPFKSKKIVLNIGSHESRKNIKKMVDVVDLLGDGFHFIQAGRPIDGAAFNDNIVYAQKKQIGFTFLGEIEQSQLSYLYSNSEIYLNLSSFEGFGRTPVEAQSFGLKVFSTTVGGLREALEVGFISLSDSDSPSAIAYEIKKVLDSKEKMENVQRDGYVNYSRFSRQTVCNDFLEVIDA
ncbi:glycosyltransferase family 4 protein [Vibrio cyclitrophicus]